MGAGNSSQGQVYKGRARNASPFAGGAGVSYTSTSAAAAQPDGKLKMPEMQIRTITWTRESHGLFEFAVKESERKLFEKKQFKIKGNHLILRNESDVVTE